MIVFKVSSYLRDVLCGDETMHGFNLGTKDWEVLQKITSAELLQLDAKEQDRLFYLALREQDQSLLERIASVLCPSDGVRLEAANSLDNLEILEKYHPSTPHKLNCLLLSYCDGPALINLVKIGAVIDWQNDDGDTALHQMVMSNDEEGVRNLLACGARNLPNKAGATPLALARKSPQRISSWICWFLERRFAED